MPAAATPRVPDVPAGGSAGEPTRPQPGLGYRPALDGLRALAVILVVAVHATYLLVPEWGGRWVPGGFLGVDIFFVLSGFLITTLLFEEHDRAGTVSLRSFFARRATRLLPPVGALLLAHALIAAVTHSDLGVEGRTAAGVTFYALNWVIAGGGSVAAGLGHLWSLSVEEQFYLGLPLLLLLAFRRQRPTGFIVVVALTGIAWATGTRAWLWLHGSGWEAVYVRTDARMDELLMGVLLAVAFSRGWRPQRSLRSVGVGGLAVFVLCVVLVRRDTSWLYIGGGFTVVGLAALTMVASLLDTAAPLARAFAWRPVVGLGRASYSLYLWHVPVFAAVTHAFAGRPAAERLAMGVVGCIVATTASYHLVEMPVMRLRRRRAVAPAVIAPHPAPPPTPQAAAHRSQPGGVGVPGTYVR